MATANRYRIRETFTAKGKPTIQRKTKEDSKSWLLKLWKSYAFCLPGECPEGYTDCYLELVRSDGTVEKKLHCKAVRRKAHDMG